MVFQNRRTQNGRLTISSFRLLTTEQITHDILGISSFRLNLCYPCTRQKMTGVFQFFPLSCAYLVVQGSYDWWWWADAATSSYDAGHLKRVGTWQCKIFTIQKNRMEQYKIHRPLWDDMSGSKYTLSILGTCENITCCSCSVPPGAKGKSSFSEGQSVKDDPNFNI